MLKSIVFDVTVLNDGKEVFSLKNFQHKFENGMTAITGKNGSGKSMVTEMIEFAFHGNSALRGKSEDYKVLNVTLTGEVNGKEFLINRTKNNATLTIDDVPSASGTTAVNKAVVDLFGYSADVFKVANVARQGEIEKLGDMKPTERKRLVDETVGLNVLDGLETYIAGEAKASKATLAAYGEKQALPEKPVLDVSLSLEEIETTIRGMNTDKAARDNLIVQMTRNIGDKPVEPVNTVQETQEELEAIEQNRNQLIGQLASLQAQQKALNIPADTAFGLKPIAPTFLNDEEKLTADLQKFMSIKARVFEKTNSINSLEAKKPTIEIPDLELAKNILAKYLENKEQINLRDSLREHKVPHDCPACNHHWEDADPRLEALEKIEELPVPEFDQDDIDLYIKRLDIERDLKDMRADCLALSLDLPEDPQGKLKEIKDYKEALSAYEKYAKFDELQLEINKIIIPDSVKDKLDALNKYTANHRAYTVHLENWNELFDQKTKAEAELKDPKYNVDFDVEINRLNGDRDKHIIFKQQMLSYDKDVIRIDELNAKIDAVTEEIDQWRKVREAVMLLRAKVKGFLLPSLNKVASHLLAEMTEGKFSWITVSDEFEITVEGQRMETLSGGGKAVANLALRLALGQVLTNRVFSVVMLDEIDAACDDERASSMAAAVRNLSEKGIIKQIILISHKQGIDADHFIRMGN